MEHVTGEPLVSFLDACERSGDGAGAAARDHVLATLVDVHCAQVLRHGLFQGDPHPGNFLVADGRRLVLLDFGAARPLDDATRRAYGELAGAILVGNARRAATLLHDLGFRTASGDAEPLVELAELVLELFRESAATSLADVDPERSLAAFLGVIEANPVVQLPDHFVLLGRVFAALGGLLVRYRPRIGLFGILVSHLAH
jgi:predicted unusual protein kinase regulating ubiquinone biosynthesis (AarF/ABC1/UbiB family)